MSEPTITQADVDAFNARMAAARQAEEKAICQIPTDESGGLGPSLLP